MRFLTPRFFLAVLGLAFIGLTVTAPPADSAPKPKRLLVVTVTKGFRHDSIPTAEKVLQKLADESKGAFVVDYARTEEELKAKTTSAALNSYDGAFFANTTGDLPLADKDAFIGWVKAGHGFLGAHSASDTFHEYRPYVEMLGGEFASHGAQVEVECRVEDHKHPATKNFDKSFKVFDEIYLFKSFDRARVHGLITLDAHPNEKTPGDYPVAWWREEGKGRIFYTSLGHRDDVWNADWYQKHLVGGIHWALRI